MVDPVSMTFVVGAMVGGGSIAALSALAVLLWKMANSQCGPKAQHFPDDPWGAPRPSLVPDGVDGADPAAAAAATGPAAGHSIFHEFPIPEWLNCENNLNFAVCGEADVGKSKLVTLLCNLPPGTAASGQGPTTLAPTTFPLFACGCKVPNVNVIDLPGAGTTDEPAAGYIVKNGLRWMSSVILVLGPTVKETDVDLINRLVGFNVPIYIVRSKLDLACTNAISDQYERIGRALTLPEKRAVAEGTLERERTRLWTDLDTDDGINLSDEAKKKISENMFLTCGRAMERDELAVLNVRDELGLLKKAIWVGVARSYASPPESEDSDRRDSDEFDEENDDFALYDGSIVHRRLLPESTEMALQSF